MADTQFQHFKRYARLASARLFFAVIRTELGIIMYYHGSSRVLSAEAMCRIIGSQSPVALTCSDMAKCLRVAFYPEISGSEKLQGFLERFRSALMDSGATVLSYDQALAEGQNGKIGEGIVLVAPGEGRPGNLAIDHVASLSKNSVLGILDGTLGGLHTHRLQKRVDALIGALVWHMAHVLIYVDDETWTLCTMNGAMSTFSLASLRHRVIDTVIPKLAAPVLPLQKHQFATEITGFNSSAVDFQAAVDDLVTGAEFWGKAGLLASQTRISELAFRSPKYRRIACAFLNWRTGMSYGFLVHQLPSAVSPAIDLSQAAPALRLIDWEEKDFYEVDNHICVAVRLRNNRFLVRIPEVSVLSTRSGCEKTQLDPQKDILKLTLRNGEIIVTAAENMDPEIDCQPSFDTLTILSNAIGNAIIASLLATVRPRSQFLMAFTCSGLALAHWHGYVDASGLPAGYYFHGPGNPPVSCSTPQAAIFALAGKLNAFEQSVGDGIEYLGDIHEEPSHGTNATGRSLFELAQLALGSAA